MMSHTLQPIAVPPELKASDPSAVGYDMGGLRIIVGAAPEGSRWPGRMVSISVKDHTRFPTVEEVVELLTKVPEIDRKSEWSLMVWGDGTVSPIVGSKTLWLFEGVPLAGRTDLLEPSKS